MTPTSIDLEISKAKTVVRAFVKKTNKKVEIININLHKDKRLYLFNAIYDVISLDNNGLLREIEMSEKNYKRKTFKEVVNIIDKLSKNEKVMGLEVNKLFLEEVNKVVNGLSPTIKFNNAMIAQGLDVCWELFKEI